MSSADFGRDYTIMPAVVCPLCGIRRARRSCPAVGQQICAVCCGTKRLTQIACPSDCPWLVSAREHPAAAVVRQRQRDMGLLMQMMRDFDQRQSQLFLMVCTFLKKYPSPELQPLVDDDVAEAMTALAGLAAGGTHRHHAATGPREGRRRRRQCVRARRCRRVAPSRRSRARRARRRPGESPRLHRLPRPRRRQAATGRRGRDAGRTGRGAVAFDHPVAAAIIGVSPKDIESGHGQEM